MSKQVVFAYIKDYQCLKDVSFNFLPEMRMAYDKDSRILSVEKTTFPHDFYPDQISSISVIVGMNGSGKTSALRWLMERCLGGYSVGDLNGIIAIKETSTSYEHDVASSGYIEKVSKVIKVYYDIDIWGCLNHTDMEFRPIDTRGKIGKEINISINIPMVFAADCFDILRDNTPTDFEWVGEQNLSTSYLLVHDLKNYGNHDTLHSTGTISDHSKAYAIQNSLRICLLILDPRFRDMLEGERGSDGKANVKLPTYILFTPNSSAEENIRRRLTELQNEKFKSEAQKRIDDFNRTYGDEYIYFENVLNLHRILPPTLSTDESEIKECKLNRFLNTSLISFFYNLYNQNFDYFTYEMKKAVLTDILKDLKRTTLPTIKWVEHIINSDILTEADDKTSKDDTYQLAFIERCQKFFKGLLDSLKFLMEDAVWDGETPYLSAESVGKSLEAKDKLVRVMRNEVLLTERIFDMRYSYELNRFSRLSSGELNLLNLFSRIRNAWVKDAEVVQDGLKPSLLLLDEVEVGYHPEWQRRFISRLVHFLAFLATPDNPVQVIYTTHSPITLSDMPKQCVNFLRLAYDGNDRPAKTAGVWNDRRQTFGENIFSLYHDSFFLDGAPMGYRVQNLISSWESRLAEEDLSASEIKEMEEKIGLIGDERLKKYLNTLLDEHREKNIDLEIDRLSKEIERLQKIKYEQSNKNGNE